MQRAESITAHIQRSRLLKQNNTKIKARYKKGVQPVVKTAGGALLCYMQYVLSFLIQVKKSIGTAYSELFQIVIWEDVCSRLLHVWLSNDKE